MVDVEQQKVLHIRNVCVCSLGNPACNAHVSYCHLWPARLYDIFPFYLINGRILGGKNVIEHKMGVLTLSTQRLSETFLIIRRTERDMVNVPLLVFM